MYLYIHTYTHTQSQCVYRVTNEECARFHTCINTQIDTYIHTQGADRVTNEEWAAQLGWRVLLGIGMCMHACM
jgi:hypothetical protein